VIEEESRIANCGLKKNLQMQTAGALAPAVFFSKAALNPQFEIPSFSVAAASERSDDA
jgi:hypothetical protein